MAAEPTTSEGHSEHFQAHQRDYSKFLRLLKVGAIASFILAMIVLVVISN